MWSIVIASKGIDDDDEVGEQGATITNKEDDPIPIYILSQDASEHNEPSLLSRVTYSIYEIVSYCLQAAGAFFFVGLLLNLSGFGYAFDIKNGLVIDTIQNIRNEAQFEREMEQDAMGRGPVGSRLLDIDNKGINSS